MPAVKAKMIWDECAEALRYTTSGDRAKIRNPCTLAYWELCELTNWPLLRRSKALTVGAGNAVALPADAIDVTGVVSADAVYEHVAEEDRRASDGNPHWYYAADGAAGNLTGALRLGLVDGQGEDAGDTVTVYYWVYPPALAQDDDLVLLPGSRALILKTLVDMLGLMDKKEAQADRYRQEYETAIATLLAKFPPPPTFSPRRGLHGETRRAGGRR